jgi:hypothetical protein
MSETPEWFEITADDQKPELPKTKKRGLKLALIAAPILLVGGVVAFADGGAEADDAPAINNTIPTATSTGSQANEQVAPATGSTIATPTAAAKKGVGVQAPSAQGGNDDHFANDPDHGAGTDRPQGFGEHPEGTEHHDRGEHGQKGTAPKIPTSGTTTTKN